jgi:hypothetical protein
VDGSGFVALRSVWSRDGEASVVFGALEDAGFHPMLECDPRGWMHFYGWPFGSSRPTTIFVPHDEHDEASRFLDAACEPMPLNDGGASEGYYSAVHDYRRWVYAGWLLEVPGLLALIVGLIGVTRAISGWRETA